MLRIRTLLVAETHSEHPLSAYFVKGNYRNTVLLYATSANSQPNITTKPPFLGVRMSSRRSFLASSSAAVAASFAISQFTPKRVSAQSLGLNQNILNASAASHLTTTANVYGETAVGADWKNMSNAATALYNNMIQTGFDAKLKSAIANVTPNQINPNMIDQSQVLESIQAYQPDFQMADLNLLMALIPTDQSSLSSTLTRLKTNGLSPTVQSAAARFNLICTNVNAALNPDGNANGSPYMEFKSGTYTGHLKPASFNRQMNVPHLQRAVWQRIERSLNNEGGGGYNCATDGAAALAVGTVFAVIAIMAGPAGALVYAAEWGALSLWGGSAAAAWGLGHAVFCGF